MDEAQKVEVTEVSELDTVTEKPKEQESAVKSEPVVENLIPEKYRGKSTKDLIDELETANKNMGRYTNELGEVRKLADELIKASLTKPKEQEVSNEIDFFENPQEAIRRAVATDPTVKQASDYAVKAQQELAKQRMVQLHPDVNQVIQEQGFIEWIGKSQIRQQLFKQANEYNVDAADELLSTYKELRSVKQTAISETEKVARDKAITAASVDTGGSGEKSKKIFKRADLMKLMIKNRRKYESMQNEIAQAYIEGRVK